MSELIDKCPKCGEQSLVAVCCVVVEYTIINDGEADQDWSRYLNPDAVDDDSSEVVYIKCSSCGKEWHVIDDDAVEMIGGCLAGLKDTEEWC